MLKAYAPLAVAALAMIAPAPAAAIEGSDRYKRAIDCSANAVFLAEVFHSIVSARQGDTTDAREVEELTRDYSNRWLLTAVDIGEFSETQVVDDRREKALQVTQLYVQTQNPEGYVLVISELFQMCVNTPPW